jgi:8-oxo-dGTP pyrophosphatase MutT (NUDIX family)
MEQVDIVNLFIKHPTEKKFLAVLRSQQDSSYGGMWALPGGKIEKDEDITTTAKRELLEETGASLSHIDLSPLILSPLSFGQRTYIIGVYEASIETSIFVPQDKDITKVAWIDSKTLIESLKEHKYPKDQVVVLEKFLETTQSTILDQSKIHKQ